MSREARGAATESAKSSSRLDILISEYQACRDDDRATNSIIVALWGVATTVIGLLVAGITQTCDFNTNRTSCVQAPSYLLAAAPLLPIMVFAYAQAQSSIGTLRWYYMRGLEDEIRQYARAPFAAFGTVPLVSSLGIQNELVTLRRGWSPYRLLINFVILAVIALTGGLIVYIGAHLETGYRIGMILVYGPVTLLLIGDMLGSTMGGRNLFVKTAQSFTENKDDLPKIPARSERTERHLLSYILVPRPEDIVKRLIAPAVFAVTAWSIGTLDNWRQFLLLWFIFEYLIYNARYQWNDTRGIDEDQIHAERSSRKRLPVGLEGQDTLRNVKISLAIAIARLLTAVLIGIYTGLLVQISVLIVVVFGVAVAYEILRSATRHHAQSQLVDYKASAPISPGGHAAKSTSNFHWQIYCIWIVVGVGYAIRAGVGFISAHAPLTSSITDAGLAFFLAFGVTFVLLTWVLEATSYCQTANYNEEKENWTWYKVNALDNRPHIAELIHYADLTPKPVLSAPPGLFPPEPIKEGGAYGGSKKILTEPLLKRTAPKLTPWNVALLAGAEFGTITGISLAMLHKNSAPIYVVAAGISLGAAIAIAVDYQAGRRIIWAIAAALALSVLPIIGASRFPLALVASFPWIAIVALYIMFRQSSYTDLKKFTIPAMIDQLRNLLIGVSVITLKAIVGSETWQRLQEPSRNQQPETIKGKGDTGPGHDNA